LAWQGANKGIFITTLSFTREAEQFIFKTDMEMALIDGEKLADLMIENNVGVSVIDKYELKKIDDDYFTQW